MTELKVWDTAEELYSLAGNGARFRSVVITPDGSTAVSASEDNKLKVWDLVTGAELRTQVIRAGFSAWRSLRMVAELFRLPKTRR